MFVSKKKYDALAGDVEYYRIRVIQLLEELEDLNGKFQLLKASRARSNENLKLGTAASAKARRKKVVAPVDWSKPIAAFHEDGRVVGVVIQHSPTKEMWTTGGGLGGVWYKDGTAWSLNDKGWTVRNVA